MIKACILFDSEDELLAMALKASLEESEKLKGGHIHMVDPALLPGSRPGRVRQDSYHEQTGDFPTIDGHTKESSDDAPSHSKTLATTLAYGANRNVQNGAMAAEDFPALGDGPGHVAHKVKHGKVWTLNQDDFPSLRKKNAVAKQRESDFPALRHSNSGVNSSNISMSAPKIKSPVIERKSNVVKSNSGQKKYREPSPEPIPLNTSTYQSGVDPMKKQVTLIKGSDIMPEKSVEKSKPPSQKGKPIWDDDFPALGGKTSQNAPVSTNWGGSATKSSQSSVTNTKNQNESNKNVKPVLGPDDFPTLGGTKNIETPAIKTQWAEKVSSKPGKTKQKGKKEAVQIAESPLLSTSKTSSVVPVVSTEWQTVEKKSTKQPETAEKKSTKEKSDSSGDLSQNKNKNKKKNRKKAGKKNSVDNETSGSDLSSDKLKEDHPPVTVGKDEKEIDSKIVPKDELEKTDMKNNNVTSSALSAEETQKIVQKLYEEEPVITKVKKQVLRNSESDFPSLSDVMVPRNPKPVFEVIQPVVANPIEVKSSKSKVIPTLSDIAATLDQSNINNSLALSSAISGLSVQDFSEVQPAISKKAAPPPGMFKNDPPGFDSNKVPPGILTKKAPPGLISSPPGITKAPPPGFNTAQKPEVISPSEDKSTDGLRQFYYQQPEGFQDRNKRLVSDVQDACQHDNEKFTQFKHLSSEYRQNTISATDYYNKCSELMGKEKFSKVFLELLILLPDINKQQDLLKAYSVINEPSGKVSKKASWVTQDNLNIKVCSDCKQVLCDKDYSDHIHQTETQDFPSLASVSTGGSGGVLQAWVKAK